MNTIRERIAPREKGLKQGEHQSTQAHRKDEDDILPVRERIGNNIPERRPS